MKPELEKKLFEKYPKIFAAKDLGIYKSPMAWGITCGDGWYTLIDRLCSFLQWGTDKQGEPQVEASQVKEKFGGLRFYVYGASDKQYAAIDFAEYLSKSICEWCGGPGKQEVQGWIVTLCESCKKSYDEGHRPWRDE